MAEQNNKATRHKRLNETILLKYLKEKFESAVGHKMICAKNDDKISEKKRPYYFEKLECNILPEGMKKAAKEAYEKGGGQEFNLKMRALRSSSAMTFNIFGNDSVTIESGHKLTSGTYDIVYEKKFSTLRSAKANIDVCLKNDNEILLFEMKMAEWLLNSPSKLRRSYLREEGYPDKEFFDVIKKIIDKYRSEKSAYDREEYSSETTYFDVFQIIKHIFGIYKEVFYKKELKIPASKKITLVCGMWTIEDKNFSNYEEYEKISEKIDCEFKTFHKNLKSIRDIFLTKDIIFDVIKLSVNDIIDSLNKKPDKKNYLQRYYTR